MLNTPGIPSVIRKRAQTPPHLRPDATTTARGPGAQDPEDLKTQQQEQMKKMETIYHAGDILEAAKVLDLNILRDTALLWIAEDFWLSPLPDDWEEAVTDEDHAYYVNAKTGVTQWEHPLEQYYKGLIHMKKGCQEEVDRAKMANPPSEVEVREMGDYFGVDLDAEPHCRHLLEEAVCMPLPPGWRDDEQSGNFVNDRKGITTTNHPLDPYFVESIRRMRVSVLRRTQPKKATSVEQAEAVSVLLAARAEGKPPIEILGLHPSAYKAEARRRFRYLSLLVHPDKNASAGAADAFKVLADAYKAL